MEIFLIILSGLLDILILYCYSLAKEVINMNKEEILSKARKQKEPDEMETEVLAKSLGVSTIVIPILCLIFIIMRMVRNNYIISDLVVLVLSQVLIQEVYQYIKIRSKKTIFFIVLTSLLTIGFIINFIFEVSL